MSEVQRRRIRAPRQCWQRWPRTPARLLRLLALSGLRLYHAAHADRRTMSQVRRALHRRKENQDRRRPRLPQGRLRLGATCPRSPATNTAGRSSGARGSQVLIRQHLQKQDRDSSIRRFVRAYTVSGLSCGVVAANERIHREIYRIPAVREEFLAAYGFELRQRPRPVCDLSFAAGRAATRALWHHAQTDPRVHCASARSGPEEKFHRAEARGVALLFQVLRSRRPSEGKPRAPCSNAEVAQAHSFGAFCGRDEWLPQSAC